MASQTTPACSLFMTKPAISRLSRTGTCPTDSNRRWLRSMTAGAVQGDGTSSTTGSR